MNRLTLLLSALIVVNLAFAVFGITGRRADDAAPGATPQAAAAPQQAAPRPSVPPQSDPTTGWDKQAAHDFDEKILSNEQYCRWDGLTWQTDAAAAVRVARAEHKPILVVIDRLSYYPKEAGGPNVVQR